jgi:hypothetical protein
LKKEDQIKTAFITPYGAYAYKTMSFGLKNAGATYQRAIQLCFADQLHRNVEAYVDDVVVKTKTQDQFITDLEETFNSLRKFIWKLNPTKCVFGVPSGKLLGYRQQLRNRGESREGQCHQGHGRSSYYQGCLEAYRLHGSSEPIPV